MDDIKPEALKLAIDIKAEAERRHKYTCDGKLTLQHMVRAAHDFKCSTCGAIVSISDLEVTLYEAVTSEPVDAAGVRKWMDNGGGDMQFGNHHVHIVRVEVAANRLDADRWILELDKRARNALQSPPKTRGPL